MVLKQETIHRLLRFFTVGGCSAVADYAVLWLLRSHSSPMTAFSIAYGTGVAVHFLLNKYWTFRCSRTDLLRQMAEYLAVAVVIYLVQGVGFRAGLALFHGNIFIAKLLAIPPGTLVGFFVLRARVFREARGA